jgi:hypothetical protein
MTRMMCPSLMALAAPLMIRSCRTTKQQTLHQLPSFAADEAQALYAAPRVICPAGAPAKRRWFSLSHRRFRPRMILSATGRGNRSHGLCRIIKRPNDSSSLRLIISSDSR